MINKKKKLAFDQVDTHSFFAPISHIIPFTNPLLIFTGYFYLTKEYNIYYLIGTYVNCS